MKEFRKLLIISLIFILFSIGNSFPQSRNLGVGFIVGSPTGLSAKYWTTGINAIAFGLGYSFEKNTKLHLHSDYLFNLSSGFNTSEKISIYYGPGVRLKFQENDNSRLGLRGALGGFWIPRGTIIEIFIEIAPTIDLIPSTDFSFDGGLGIRFFLN
ncbi:MAG: hypothetical protein NZM09_02315 [Ignavibacterium sp.]|nr:hypothetical protein [Ignavibacterium sp.]MCX7612301.1 hypothetical protein [Ignavibacterium sp.]MDW8374510.1 hypothetical protein [Ignavibacteriales bacterium]